MFVCLALSILLQTPPEYLVVDGIVVGRLEASGWQPSRSISEPITIGASEVGIAATGHQVANVRLQSYSRGTWVEALGAPAHSVLFTGKAWTPREAGAVLDRSQLFSSVGQFARNRGVKLPHPYLRNVWEVELDGVGNPEQIIEVTSNPRAGSGEPKWQAVLLRWQEKGQERLYPLSLSFPQDGKVAQCRLRAVADFDGDGQMELVSTAIQDSLFVATVWTFREGKLLPVVDTTVEITPIEPN